MPATFTLPGPEGRLEAVLDLPADLPQTLPAIAVIGHPHSLHGGSLHNKVVYMLAKTCVKLGVPALRFNFRGVGRSAGEFDHGRGEQADLGAAAAWLRERLPDAPLWLGGFSFGGFVAWQAHEAVQADRLLLVAPPVDLFDFGPPREIAIPWCVIQGARDEIVSPGAVRDWIAAQPRPPVYRELAGAGHFFHGRLNDLRREAEACCPISDPK